jgi:hypothetical protein
MSAELSIEFCKDMIREAKEFLVSEEGIGSDVAPCVIAFDQNSECLGWAQMIESASDRLDQYQRLALVAGMMRSGWHADGVALVVEGYMMIGDSEGEESLAKLFAAGDQNVHECISIVYGNSSGEMRATSIPYKQELGRKITWLTESVQVVDEGASGSFIEVIRYLFDVVEMIPWPTEGSPSRYMTAVASQMGEHGFMLVCGIPGTTTDWDSHY